MPKSKALSEWLEKIGAENCPEASAGADGTIKTQSNDEALARLLWKQALGYIETITTPEGQVAGQRAHAPDRNSQQIILERREGKPAITEDEESKAPELVDKLSQAIVDKLNRTINESDDSDS